MTKTKKKVTLKEYNKNVKKANIKFEGLTKPEKAVFIAKDVIRQINTHKITARSGAYIESKTLPKGIWEKDIKANYSRIQNCTVCAMGACVLAITKQVNKLKFEDINMNFTRYSANPLRKMLSSVFSPTQLFLIEQAFEGTDSSNDRVGRYMGAKLTYTQIDKCNLYKYKFQDQNERLKEIMKNIITNNGKFIPDLEY